MNKIELIFLIHFKKKYNTKFHTDININHLVELTKNYSSAYICSLFMEAKWLAESENIIHNKHIEEAFQQITRSPITKEQLKIYMDFIDIKKPKDTGFKFEL